jgi:hypothetical protein
MGRHYKYQMHEQVVDEKVQPKVVMVMVIEMGGGSPAPTMGGGYQQEEFSSLWLRGSESRVPHLGHVIDAL